MDTTKPDGISLGYITTRPIKSAVISKRPPKRPVTTKFFLCFIPVKNLAIWGANRPIKPTVPTVATPIAASRIPTRELSSLILWTFVPMAVAISCPSITASRFLQSSQAIGPRVRMATKRVMTLVQFLP